MDKDYTDEDMETNKILSGLAYIFFFIPLLACPDSGYGRFHANQSLTLTIISSFGFVGLLFIPIVGWILIPIFAIFTGMLMTIGFINVFNNDAKPLPLIGHITIIDLNGGRIK